MENTENNQEEQKFIEIDTEDLKNLLNDSFSTIEQLETEMASITSGFESLDDNQNIESQTEQNSNDSTDGENQ